MPMPPFFPCGPTCRVGLRRHRGAGRDGLRTGHATCPRFGSASFSRCSAIRFPAAWRRMRSPRLSAVPRPSVRIWRSKRWMRGFSLRLGSCGNTGTVSVLEHAIGFGGTTPRLGGNLPTQWHMRPSATLVLAERPHLTAQSNECDRTLSFVQFSPIRQACPKLALITRCTSTTSQTPFCCRSAFVQAAVPRA